ncbi:hypothetical protein EYF80_015747 [Liparis tanakae]|uniref:Uncharacterized protein n=1 Tax=Liparis tanakae TaxID=230148 RepID=A0A4Z2I7T7_9TELE|nr:hypothetical protein EYF80_015747 [Liparis tanakae]
MPNIVICEGEGFSRCANTAANGLAASGSVEGGEPLRGAGQQVRLLEEHDQHRAHPEVLRLPEVVMEVGGEALEGVGARLLRYDAQQVGQLLRGEGHGLLASVTQSKLLWRSASSKLLSKKLNWSETTHVRRLNKETKTLLLALSRRSA